MISSRTFLRSTRAIRAQAPAIRRNARFASDTTKSSAAAGGGSGAVAGGLAGAGAATVIGYLWYSTSGAKSAVATAKEAKSYYDSATQSLKVKFDDIIPTSSEALDTLKQSAYKYAAFIPGGRGYVDTAFKDIDVIREKHKDEVDQIIRDAYGELRDTSKKGLSLETATDAWEVFSKYFQKLTALASDAAQDVLQNHPQVKEKLGGSFDQLKQMGDSFGPEAKKQVDETWSEIQDILKSGLQWNTIEKIRKLVEDKKQQVQKMGDEAWAKGKDQLKSTMDKNPQVKKLVEENEDVLKKGNIAEILSKVKDAVSSGSTEDLEKYVKTAKDKAQQYTSSNLDGWLNMIPQGSQIIPQLSKIKDLAEKEGKEAQQLAKDTVNDIIKILEKRSGEAEKLAKDAGKKSTN